MSAPSDPTSVQLERKPYQRPLVKPLGTFRDLVKNTGSGKGGAKGDGDAGNTKRIG